jgi:hypothetical protein
MHIRISTVTQTRLTLSHIFLIQKFQLSVGIEQIIIHQIFHIDFFQLLRFRWNIQAFCRPLLGSRTLGISTFSTTLFMKEKNIRWVRLVS